MRTMETVVVYASGTIGLWSAALILRIRAIRRAELAAGLGQTVDDPYDAAFLAGGPGRVVDTALAVMHLDGRIRIGGPGIVAAVAPTADPAGGPAAHDPVERAVLERLAVAPNGSLSQVRGAVMRSRAVQDIGDALAARGLMTPPKRRRRALSFWGHLLSSLSVLAIPVSIVVTVIGSGLAASPFGVPFILPLLPAIVLGLGVGSHAVGFADRRTTKPGRRALKAHGARYAEAGDPARLVATKGPSAVPDAALRPVLVAAALAPVVFVAAAAGGGGSSEAEAAAQWCGSAPGGSCGASGEGDGSGASGGGDGGDGGGCGGCGGCGCG
ncbi:hypothetical protein GCM10010387_31090 [Streptomyces inusitatus]|uniref:TIGR04222 domain-containing membrane protein n=1 Tax=Streptomyces inusitatus TaxID=68221 RepID=A0A918UV23_9ACTN|nr:TIGR04222 domain-containing membrane protein [Streptomyces inusitatus]GGZ34830.1 hypothetical protein GCM10010387_31090 [Streptomyces inusitatus]